jgi:hypothetical protein
MRSELRGAALDAADGLEQFGQLGAAERRHHRAVVKPQLDQAFVRQLLQRLAQRGPRNAERVGQVRLPQRLSRRQLAAHDHGAQPRSRLLVQSDPRHAQAAPLLRRDHPLRFLAPSGRLGFNLGFSHRTPLSS